MSIERLYGKLNTHKMEQDQRQVIYGPGTVDNKNTTLLKTTALVMKDVVETETRTKKPVVERYRRLVKLNSQRHLRRVMKMTFIQWKNLNNYRIRQRPIWQESSRTLGL